MFSIFKKINYFAGRWKNLDYVAIFSAIILPYLMLVFLLTFSFYRNNLWIFFYALAAGFLGRFGINELIHIIYKRQRPALLKETKTLIPIPKDYSLPSGHASFFFAISFFLFFYNVILALIFLAISLIIGVARVFCGVHWFRDILAGAGVGLISAFIIKFFIAII